jgi:hypothetical protein
VQPHRVDVVRIDRAMTLAQFNAQYPSAVPIADIALLNQLPSADAQLAAGSLVKRVIAS